MSNEQHAWPHDHIKAEFLWDAKRQYDQLAKLAAQTAPASCDPAGHLARLDVVNVFDEIYELRDGSGIGVGAPQFGQRRGCYGGLTLAF